MFCRAFQYTGNMNNDGSTCVTRKILDGICSTDSECDVALAYLAASEMKCRPRLEKYKRIRGVGCIAMHATERINNEFFRTMYVFSCA